MRSVLSAVGVLCLSSVVFAQSDRGTITGTITDPGGLVISGAPIEVANVENGAKYQVGSSATGNYVVQVPTGTYTMSVVAPGFKRYIRPNLVVPVEQTLRVDIALSLGSNTESVTVTDSAPLLKTESGEMSHNITSETMDNLPVLGIGAAAVGSTGIRSAFSVTQLMPGAYWNPDQSLRVNGMEGNSASLRVEGQDATNVSTNGGYSQTEPSVEAVQEFAVQTSNFAAEFGQAGGGLFNVTMKSGTNRFHGSGYDYFVDEFLNAGYPFTNNGTGGLLRPEQRRNDYGFSLGGPVFIPKVYNGHDKTFFFFNFEQFRETVVTNNLPITVPTLAYRQGNFSQALITGPGGNLGTDGLGRPIIANTIYDPTTAFVQNGVTYTNPYPNNTIPLSQQDPVALKVQALFPLPTSSGLINNFLDTYANPRVSTIPSVKIDHSFNSNLKLSGYWSETNTESPNVTALAFPLGSNGGSSISAKTVRLNLDYIITPTLLLHFGGGVIRATSTPNVGAFDNSTIGLKGTNYNEFPYFSALSGAQGGMANFGTAGNSNSESVKPTSTVSLTWVRNNHTYKVGGEVIINGYVADNKTYSSGYMLFSPTQTALPSLNGVTLASTVGFAYASFLIGAPNTGYDSVPAAERVGSHSLDGFVQDSWKVTRKLTIDYGLRYDFQTYDKEHNGYMFEVGVNTPNPAAGGEPGGIIFESTCHCSFAHNYPFAFGPRLGLAYQFLPKTVFRAGVGVSYAKTPDDASTLGNAGSVKPFAGPAYGVPPFTLAQGLPYQITFPDFYAGQQPLAGTVGNPTNEIDPNAGRPARILQWTAGFQRELSNDLVVEASYVGNRGAWWSANTLTPQASNAIDPNTLAAYGLSWNNPADLSLLSAPLTSSIAASRTYACTPAVFSNGAQTTPAHPGGSSTCSFATPPYPGFPTGLTVAQTLRQFPEYTGIVQHWTPLGDTWYNALQAKLTKRFSHGLTGLVTYTWSKSMTLGAEDDNNYASPTTPVINNVFNRANQKTFSGYDQPQVLIISGTYITPGLTGNGFLGNKYLSWVARDWTLGAVMHYASGLLIKVPSATTGLAAYTEQNTTVDRVPGVPLFTQNLNCHCFDPNTTFVLNPAAWANPPTGQYGTASAYYTDYRQQRHPGENVSLARTFRIREGVSFQIRAEFTNIFNRTGLNAPTSTNAFAPQTKSGNQTTAGFGYINTAPGGGGGTNPAAGSASSLATPPPRQGQLVARFTF